MLKGEKYSSVVKQNNLLAVQLNHLSKSPSSIQTKIDPNFAATIQTQYQDPSKMYFNQMKSLFRDDLTSSLLDQAEKLNHQKQTGSNKTKECQARLDGVLYQLEKNNLNYNLSLQRKMNKQQERKKMFIDEDRLKNSKIQSIVQKWEDKDLFNHQSDLYQTYQKQEHQNTQEMLKMQRENKIQQNLLRQREKQLDLENRIRYERQMEMMKVQAAQNKIQNQRKYGTELSTLAQQKRARQSLSKMPAQTTYRHNPITNPLQYHIDNPYLLKRMQQRQR